MPDQIIQKVDRIGLHQKQGQEFCFLNRVKEPCEWTDIVLEDNPKFQGLLEEEAPFPNVSAEFLGVPTKEEKEDFEVVAKEPSLEFEDLLQLNLIVRLFSKLAAL